jgi:hypothetical protein
MSKRSLQWGWLGALALACGCQGTVTGADGVATLRVVESLPRGGSTVASIRTLANATCGLRIAGQADPSQKLHVYSDDEGMVRIHLQHTDPTVDGGDLTLSCTDDVGRTASIIIAVKVDDRAVAQQAAAFSVYNKPRLAALDVDPLTLTNTDLVARHYPPRPDANTSPDNYAKWLQLVTSTPTVITSHVVVDPDRAHGPAKTNSDGSSNNWSGYVITTPPSAPEYAWIYGQWTVPRAYAEGGFFSSHHSTLWVGIDGWGSPDVVQDGTDQDTVTAFWIQTSSYDAWTEWYPFSSQTVSNFPVNPGDLIHAWTWVRDSAGNWDPNGNVGWFYLWNQTQNVYVESSTVAPSGIKLNGHAAEWVMERPTVNGSLASLARYASPAYISGAQAYDLNGQAHGYTSDTSWNVTMYNGSTPLSRVAPVDGSTMAFTWLHYQ